MTDNEKEILWLAFLGFEEAMNHALNDYFDDRDNKTEEEISNLITRYAQLRYEELCGGKADDLLLNGAMGQPAISLRTVSISA